MIGIAMLATRPFTFIMLAVALLLILYPGIVALIQGRNEW
jgi:hypothetical protein